VVVRASHVLVWILSVLAAGLRRRSYAALSLRLGGAVVAALDLAGRLGRLRLVIALRIGLAAVVANGGHRSVLWLIGGRVVQGESAIAERVEMSAAALSPVRRF
jgi:uncharacterized membrane protein